MEHRLQEGDFDWNYIIILDEERHYRKRLISEVIHQETNLQTDMEALPNAYLPIIELRLELLSRLVSVVHTHDTLKKIAVYEWHERFKSGRESVEDDERSGKPSTSKTDENINKVREMLINNRKLIIRELAEDLNIAYGSIQDIVVNGLDLRRVAAKLAPKELNFMQKRDRVVIAKYIISKAESDPTFIITGDETWVYEYDMQLGE
ncbi:PREDICTED: histone-lysine N-methyltransferase SETMAR-like [Atta colombica]|uniref:histone-lysine N-methyltransferase SETMAR-like n=1 Tax=Atta colombica TaxID=520822 RepID=UPI00084C49EF|nr:PREDICTED: histone-lysine N-methyltransferase SETMAR-like [Atta colombica]